jgi:hydroxyethylthiazole kinase-like sugar kinase family protein
VDAPHRKEAVQAMTVVDTDTRWLVAILTGCCLLALLAGTCARERDAKREAQRALALVESCADSWERTIDATSQCLTVLDDVRTSGVACACWEAP